MSRPDSDPENLQSDLAIVGSGDLKLVDSEQELLEPYAKFRENPVNAIQELGLHVLGTAWRSYDKILGREIFYPGYSDKIKDNVLAQPMLRSKIRELAKKRVEVEIHEDLLGEKGLEGEANRERRDKRRKEIEAQLLEIAEEWTGQMICKMDSKYFIRGAYYMCTQLLTRAYHQGIHVSSQEVLQLRQVAEEAAKKRQGIIFLPCHRSHVDYVSLQLICYRLGLALPVVVAGDNLNFPLVGPFLQHAGAMWIRRSFGDDQLYTTLVQSYIDTLLQNGHNFECFVEGGRSRTGKLLQPKFGILSFLLDSVMSGRVEDAMVCPVSTQYDKVIEVDSYISELLGQPKKKEDLSQFLSASNVLSLKLGRVDVRFHKPWSLRQFIDEQRPRLSQRGPSVESNFDQTLRRRLLTTFGYKVLSEINDVSVVMPTALVGTVLLTLAGRSVGRSELIRRVEWLSLRVRAAGGRVAHFAESAIEGVIDKALDVLGPNMVGRIIENGAPEEMYYAEDRFQLSFYRNMTIHLFISQALVCAAMYTRVKIGEERMSYQELFDYTYFLSQLFRAEFIFPTAPFEENLQTMLQGLVDDQVLTVLRGQDGKIEFIEIHAEERGLDLENFDFYNFLIWPFIEASWLGAIAIFMLAQRSTSPNAEAWVEMKAFQDKAQLLGKTLYHRGDLSYYEAVNKEALKNAISRSEEEGIILVTRPPKDSKAPQRTKLDADWMPQHTSQGELVPEGKLWEFCEHVNKSRRDAPGKKEGATVRRRIQGLAQVIGEGLWEDAVLEPDGVPMKIRRRQGIQTGGQVGAKL
ncbi:Glycerol-3-phosphate acyltransferase [Fulvia fulva]|uniref:Glycerol-3-phosphate acyltransferase n=1 Tax=Passalora fulva TaxID=5499 RepID=A0A9Q8USI3_PASFU|nr:Glycerol-3-phosphate acyltransferase [Fulvia fulva]KAK4617756.1 Glycerol-3-phosphate acyltransferase [Fulvia fulva]KAK4619259.1 Glycerol-3-phosphate acyltransferase [Fulvia fulva]UJO20828.1 Glycerol-3-phosphate acyltransferase [Fulvia fulva]WPV18455.1 Glycerol-3-phosphate acyltransferase [Fulvia fulva]WPV33217.1 Glycerol-3-phosphate acyltransferase [Fulvia fulva]